MIDKEGKYINVDFDKEKPQDVDQKCSYGGWTYHEVFIQKDYEKGGCEVKRGDIVVDIGANIGFFTRYASMKGAREIYSFEPDFKNFACLAENALPQCHPFNYGVMGRDGFYVMDVDKTPGGHSFFGYETGSRTGEKRPLFCISLKTIMEHNHLERIDFLKIDTEGAEEIILDSITDEMFNKIGKIVFEYHHFLYANDKYFLALLKRFAKWYKFIVTSNDRLSVVCAWEKGSIIQVVNEERRNSFVMQPGWAI